MTRTPMTAALAAVLFLLATAACGSREETLARQVEGYEVIDEGSASGVTSTLNAPGETVPVVTETPLTGTSVDTTTAFTTLDPVLGVPTETTTDTLASTLPPTTTAPPMTPQSPIYVPPPTTRRPQPAATPVIDIRRTTPAPAEPQDVEEPAEDEEPQGEDTPSTESAEPAPSPGGEVSEAPSGEIIE